MGLIFVYLVLSLFCSAMNELLEGWLKVRSKNLELGLRELLNDPKGTGLTAQIYAHPLIAGLFKGAYTPGKIDAKKDAYTETNLPSYVPSRNFALALMDAILPGNATTPSGASGAVANPPPLAVPGVPPPPPSPNTAALRTAIATLPNAAVQKALLTLVDSAGNDIVRARENIETWFDSAMDRVAGWYKRRTQFTLVAFGVVVAVVMNADTISIARRLSTDKSLRNSLVTMAQTYAAKKPGETGDASTEKIPAECEEPKTKSAEPAKDNDAAAKKAAEAKQTAEARCAALPESCQKDQTSPECHVERTLARLQTLGLPLGWSLVADDPRSFRISPMTAAGFWTWIGRILGWLLTAFAISLGAPFWFDLLNKISVVRSTVKPQEKSLPEKSKG